MYILDGEILPSTAGLSHGQMWPMTNLVAHATFCNSNLDRDNRSGLGVRNRDLVFKPLAILYKPFENEALEYLEKCTCTLD